MKPATRGKDEWLVNVQDQRFGGLILLSNMFEATGIASYTDPYGPYQAFFKSKEQIELIVFNYGNCAKGDA